MKPSQRIKEIIQTIDLAESNPFPYALIQYLDEEWENKESNLKDSIKAQKKDENVKKFVLKYGFKIK